MPPGSGPTAVDDRFARQVLPEIEVLLRVAHTLTRNGADAEDLTQDTLLRAYRAIQGFDGRHPRAWLLTIMRNTHVNRNRRQRPELLDDPEKTLPTVPATGAAGETPEELIIGRTFDAAVEEALASLSDDFRRTIELVDLHGLAYREAAEALGVPVGTVMSRVHRGRNRLRDRLAASDLAPRRRR